MLLIVTGDSGAGKSSTLARLAAALRDRACAVGGCLAPAVLVRAGIGTGTGACPHMRIGYDIVDASTETAAPTPLARLRASDGGGAAAAPAAAAAAAFDDVCASAGRFVFSAAGLAHALSLLLAARDCRACVRIFDEVGPWELSGGGLAPARDAELGSLAREQQRASLVLAVRPALVDVVLARWPLRAREHTRVVRLAGAGSGGNDAAINAAVTELLELLDDCPAGKGEAARPHT